MANLGLISPDGHGGAAPELKLRVLPPRPEPQRLPSSTSSAGGRCPGSPSVLSPAESVRSLTSRCGSPGPSPVFGLRPGGMFSTASTGSDTSGRSGSDEDEKEDRFHRTFSRQSVSSSSGGI